MPKIPPAVFDDVHLSHIPTFLLVLCNTPDRAQGSHAGFLRRHSRGDILFCQLIEMKVQFVCEFALHVLASEQ
jgi:hypothetical protein